MFGRKSETLSGWGRAPVVPGHEVRSEELARIADGRPLSRGLGRSYGDSSLPAPRDLEVVSTVLADRMLSFDAASGVLRAEAGLSLDDIYRLFLPRGWFVPVTPGTKFVTLGGMVAADVHGKNHHKEGCFGAHVTELKLRVADGRVVTCSPTVERDLFRATIGGMGLTGHILEVAFKMVRVPSPWIWQESERMPNIEAFIAGLKAASADWPMTAGWIDCLSQRAEHGTRHPVQGALGDRRGGAGAAAAAQAPVHDPVRPSRSSCSGRSASARSTRCSTGSTCRACSAGSSTPSRRSIRSTCCRHWNRMYGRRGLTQHQCVLPNEAGAGAARRFLEVLTARGGASFLCVIKDCGPEGVGMLSFPRPGISIALDIAVRKDTPALDRRVERMRDRRKAGASTWPRTRSRAPSISARWSRASTEFQRVRRIWDPDGKLRSAQSVRLFGDHRVRKVVVLGATKGMGRAVARRLAERGDALFLLGHEADDLAASARDLEVRGGRAAGSIGTARVRSGAARRVRGGARQRRTRRWAASTPSS